VNYDQLKRIFKTLRTVETQHLANALAFQSETISGEAYLASVQKRNEARIAYDIAVTKFLGE
jgi:hypothetical protein